MTTSSLPPVFFIMGPTGVGKTACAVALAQRFPIEVISVDSAQVYRGLDVGTAKPDPYVRQRCPHHLLDLIEPREAYSAARFRHDALAVIDELHKRARVPLLVGGTGLYFRTLERGIASLPKPDARVRTALAADCDRLGSVALHTRLAHLDPVSAARIHPRDPQRIMRALEVFQTSGRRLSEAHAAGRVGPLKYPLVKWVLAPSDRGHLRATLARRFHDMLRCGLVNEVRYLWQRDDLELRMPALRAVGYQQIWRYLDGEIDRDAMISTAIIATQQLAKRQLTWLRGEQGAHWFRDPKIAIEAMTRAFESLRVR